jgi:hypothetical protein
MFYHVLFVPHRNAVFKVWGDQQLTAFLEKAFQITRGTARFGSASGNRTRILALKGPRANRCTIAPQR